MPAIENLDGPLRPFFFLEGMGKKPCGGRADHGGPTISSHAGLRAGEPVCANPVPRPRISSKWSEGREPSASVDGNEGFWAEAPAAPCADVLGHHTIAGAGGEGLRQPSRRRRQRFCAPAESFDRFFDRKGLVQDGVAWRRRRSRDGYVRGSGTGGAVDFRD